MNEQVSQASAQRWQEALDEQGGPEAMFWRLLRMGSAPYFVLGVGPAGPLRLRVATPWDWRQQYRLESFGVEAQAGGQARVAWHAGVKERTSGSRIEVHGHVEIRWSHGRFRGPPEAKVYLDTPHQGVPGYFPLDPGDGIGLRAATTAPPAAIADVEPLVLFAPDAAPDDPT
jgi:hypothetical protein